MIQQLAPQQPRGQAPFPDAILSPGLDIRPVWGQMPNGITIRAIMDQADITDPTLQIPWQMWGSDLDAPRTAAANLQDDWRMLLEDVWRGGLNDRQGNPILTPITSNYKTSSQPVKWIRMRALLPRVVNLGAEAEI